MTARDQHQQAVADAYRQHERIQSETEAFVAYGLVSTAPTPTESFLSDLKAIHAASPVRAALALTPQGERPLREEETIERAFAKRAAADLSE